MYIEKNLVALRQREKLRLELEQECKTGLNSAVQIVKKIKEQSETVMKQQATSRISTYKFGLFQHT